MPFLLMLQELIKYLQHWDCYLHDLRIYRLPSDTLLCSSHLPEVCRITFRSQ
jgi:hypothetical protein